MGILLDKTSESSITSVAAAIYMSLLVTLKSKNKMDSNRLIVHHDIIGTIDSIPGFFEGKDPPIHDAYCAMVDRLDFTEQVGDWYDVVREG